MEVRHLRRGWEMTVQNTAPRSTWADLVRFVALVLRCVLSVPIAVIFTAGVLLMAGSKLALAFLQSIGGVDE